MTTVRQLIEQLNLIEDKEQVVIFQYYLAELFEYHDEETASPNKEQFAEIAETIGDYVFDDSYTFLNDYVYNFMRKQAN